MAEMKLQIPYAAISESLKKTLALTGSPVAVKLAKAKEDIPAGIPEGKEVLRHCQMVNLARKEGQVFFAPSDKHQCNGGAWALGLREITPTLRSGEFYFRLGKFESMAACRRTMDRIPHLRTGETYATIYAPLEKTPVDPDVVLIITTPRNMLKLAQASLFRLGGRITAAMAGIQSVCSDATAQTYLTGVANFSLGCDGSRRFSGIGDDEMVMGFPAEILPEISEAIRVVTAAPGSK
ncbi:MAG TPA: DUF169 domain-containing protein [Methanomicrobiales archaeon]|nr:DUF169 domain-containing protein [Methanomicrobiales archaeon]